MQITIKYGIDQMVKTYTSPVTVGQIVGDCNTRAALGYGDNVRALISGVEQASNVTLANDTTLVVETRANTKASPDITITVRYGIDSVTKTIPGPVTVGDILEDWNLKAALGWGDNVRALIAGVEQPEDAGLHHGSTLVIETRANTKAS